MEGARGGEGEKGGNVTNMLRAPRQLDPGLRLRER